MHLPDVLQMAYLYNKTMMKSNGNSREWCNLILVRILSGIQTPLCFLREETNHIGKWGGGGDGCLVCKKIIGTVHAIFIHICLLGG